MSGWRWGAGAVAAGVVLALPWALGGPGLAVAPGTPGGELSPALASLRSGEYDPRFGLEYWLERFAAGRGEEVLRAVSFCRGAELERRPNCRTVLVLEEASRMPEFLDGGRP